MPKDQQSNLQMVLPLTLDDKASFDNYFVGDNSELVQALQGLVSTTAQSILYFYGVAGVGKSHLHFALQRLAKQQKVASHYLSLADSMVIPDLLEMIDPSAIVCVDDIHLWAGKADKERALFALFEQVKNQNGQLIVSATRPPESCGFSLKDLVSRLASGLVYPLQMLNDSQQFEAIKLSANQRGISISDDVVKYMLSRSSRDSSELFDLLDRIDQTSLIEKRRITIPFLQSLFKT